MDEQAVIEATRRWIAEVVIGLELCPFARRVFEANRIRYVVSAAAAEPALLADLRAEIEALAAAPAERVETTLLIHPRVLGDFLDYNDFLDAAEGLIEELGQRGVIQVASFHPEYQFAGTAADAVENYTNRSPYPMLHLLREDSITAAGDEAGLLAIPERNIETMRRVGREEMARRLTAIRTPAPGE
jgi:hypothetical protein